MAAGFTGYSVLSNKTSFADTASLDSFSRLRVSNPEYLFDAQFTYDLQPLLYEQKTNGAGATITHDSTNRCALMAFSSTTTGGYAYMQSYDWVRYQPGRSQLYFVTFCFNSLTANAFKFAGVGDGTNGIQLEANGTTVQISKYSATTAGNATVAQTSWNLDKLDGTGPSGLTVDWTKTQILVIDYQALYVGRVRVGLDIGGNVYYFHQFIHANSIAYPYIQDASLPIRCGMNATGTVTTNMLFICASAISEGGDHDQLGFNQSFNASVTAGSGTATHLMSIQPKTTFNSITNRTKFRLTSIDLVVTGANPIRWDLVIGQALSGTNTFNDVNATYSAMQYNTAGTLSGSPAITIMSGYLAASASAKSQSDLRVDSKYPITLDAAGAARVNGRLTLLVTGLGGTSAMQGALNWDEIR